MIRSGLIRHARELVETIAAKTLIRRDRVKIANFARRTGNAKLGQQLLAPIINVEHKKILSGTPTEIVEYAACLSRLGIRSEAMRLLSLVTPTECHEVLLHRALIYISTWDYFNAKKVLLEFISQPRISEYEALVAKVNLSAAAIFLREYESASTIIDQVLKSTSSDQSRLIRMNALELLAQANLGQCDYSAASRNLATAETLAEKGGLYEFFISKWKFVTLLHLQGVNLSTKQNYLKLKQEANKHQHWESIRDCDYHWAKASKNNLLAKKLFFGTPYLLLKERYMELGINNAQDFKYRVPGTTSKVDPNCATILFNSGEIMKTSHFFKPGQIMHRTFQALSQDLYRPQTLIDIFAILFPEETYIPSLAVLRVHQALHRLNKTFKDWNLGLIVKSHDGFYTLKTEPSRQGIIIFEANNNELKTIDRCNLHTLAAAFGKSSFTTIKAAQLFEISVRSASRTIRQFEKSGHLKRIGCGPSCRYVLSAKNQGGS